MGCGVCEGVGGRHIQRSRDKKRGGGYIRTVTRGVTSRHVTWLAVGCVGFGRTSFDRSWPRPSSSERVPWSTMVQERSVGASLVPGDGGKRREGRVG